MLQYSIMINLLPFVSYFFYAMLLTYLVWGFVVSFEVNLALSHSKAAIKWLKKHYSYKGLYAEVLIFYPMILLGYFFLEYLPAIFDSTASQAKFDLDALFQKLFS